MVRAERVMEHALARAEMRERSLLETRRYIRAGLQEKAEKEEQMFAE
jgi:intracellular sulfur oxidation DsrE/DsrF family protein